jgi:hypothetical protein
MDDIEDLKGKSAKQSRHLEKAFGDADDDDDNGWIGRMLDGMRDELTAAIAGQTALWEKRECERGERDAKRDDLQNSRHSQNTADIAANRIQIVAIAERFDAFEQQAKTITTASQAMVKHSSIMVRKAEDVEQTGVMVEGVAEAMIDMASDPVTRQQLKRVGSAAWSKWKVMLISGLINALIGTATWVTVYWNHHHQHLYTISIPTPTETVPANTGTVQAEKPTK